MDTEQARTILGDEFAFFYDIIRSHLDTLGLPPDARILDVGTGKGRVAVTLALSGYRVVTGEPRDDHSPYAKQTWREEARRAGVEDRITYRDFDAAAMPFDDGAFEAVFVMGALHHMQDPAAAVAECLRVISPGGVVCVLEPTPALLERARAKFPDHPDAVDPTPFAGDAQVKTLRTEMFDIYELRRG